MARVATLVRYDAMARSAALESAVQLGTTKQLGKQTWPTLRNVGFATDALARDREASARRGARPLSGRTKARNYSQPLPLSPSES
jgi:hypothetical protein